jgi:hypothetical protein
MLIVVLGARSLKIIVDKNGLWLTGIELSQKFTLKHFVLR